MVRYIFFSFALILSFAVMGQSTNNYQNEKDKPVSKEKTLKERITQCSNDIAISKTRSGTQYMMDSLISWYGSSNNNWELLDKYEYLYDENGNIISDRRSETDEANENDEWFLYRLETYAFDDNNYLTGYTYYSGWGEEWYEDYKEEYTNNANGDVLEDYGEWKETENGPWLPNYKLLYTYDSNGLNTQSTYEYYENGAYGNYRIIDITYDSNGNMLTKTWQYWDETNALWEYTDKKAHTWDGNNNMLSDEDYVWDDGLNDWANDRKYEYTYAANGKMETDIAYSGSELTWSTDNKLTFTHDVNDRVILYVYDKWDDIQMIYAPSAKGEYVYDSFGNPTYEVISNYDETSSVYVEKLKETFTYNTSILISDIYLVELSEFKPGYDNEIACMPIDYYQEWYENGTWYNESKEEYYFSEFVAYNNIAEIENGISFYPNPANTTVNITGGSYINDIKIYSSTGILVKQVANTSEISIANLSDGIYLIKISSNDCVTIRQLVVTK